MPKLPNCPAITNLARAISLSRPLGNGRSLASGALLGVNLLVLLPLLPLLPLGFACAPNPVDRLVDPDRLDMGISDAGDTADRFTNNAQSGRDRALGMDGTGGAGGTMSPGGAGGTPARADARDAVLDQRPTPPDVAPDVPMPMDVVDMAPRPDLVPDVVVPNRIAFMVVADPAEMASADVRMSTLLVAKGFTVKLGDDDAASTVAAGSGVLILSGTSDSAKLNSKYRTTAIPTLVLEQNLFGEMRLTGPTQGTDFGEDISSQVTLIPGHPLAAGGMGTVSVLTTPADLGWGKPAATAIKVATLSGSADRIAIFAYETGAIMVGGTPAPARRVAMFLADTSVTSITPDGTKLLSAALDWLAPP